MAGRFYKLETEQTKLFIAELLVSVTAYETFKPQVIKQVSEKLEDIIGEPVSYVDELLESKHMPINISNGDKVYIIECSSSYTDIRITVNKLGDNINFQWHETFKNFK